MLLDHRLCCPATAKRTSADGENATANETEGVRAVQDLALVWVLEEAGAGRRARGSRLLPGLVDLYDSRGLGQARHWLPWQENIERKLNEL